MVNSITSLHVSGTGLPVPFVPHREEIPYQVVRNFDKMDDGDPTTPPQFACQKCGKGMYPQYYKGVHGFEYKISDVKFDLR